ncbi:hypothetical protein [Shewanella algae]|uniref:hypothetical protein n=1 Tax=Shewanella algae TaxID=38313 RepID=UPI003006C5E2
MCLVLVQIGLLVDILESAPHTDEEKAAVFALIAHLTSTECGYCKKRKTGKLWKGPTGSSDIFS